METFGKGVFITVLSGVYIALVFFVPLWGPQLVFRKLTPEKTPDTKVRFSLQDGLLLTVALAIVNATLAHLTSNSFGIEENYSTMMLAFCVNVLIVLLWLKCLQFLAEHRITNWRSRLLMQLVLYPLSTFVIAEILMGMLMLLSGLELVIHNGELQPVRYFTHPLFQAAVCVVAFFWLVRYLLRYLFVKLVIPGVEPIEHFSEQSDPNVEII